MSDQFEHADLLGKRVLLLVTDDQLFHALQECLEGAGCETFGTYPTSSAGWIAAPQAHMDVAVLDADHLEEHAPALAHGLHARGVPVLLLATPGRNALWFEWLHPLRKPFTEQQLLDGVADALNPSEKTVH